MISYWNHTLVVKMPRERILPPQKNLVSPGNNEEESLLENACLNTAERSRDPPVACTTAQRRHLLPHSRLTHCLKKKTPPHRPESNLPEPATAPLTRDAPKIDREESKLTRTPLLDPAGTQSALLLQHRHHWAGPRRRRSRPEPTTLPPPGPAPKPSPTPPRCP